MTRSRGFTRAAVRVALAALLPAAAAGATTCAVTAGAMAFGVYDTLLANANDTTGSVLVSCTPGLGDPLTTSYTLTIAGTGSGGDTVRSIVWSTHRLYYQVYEDAGRTQVWGNGGSSGAGVASSVTSAATGVVGLRSHTAYARMPARQGVAPGIYGGSLLITIDY